MQWKKTGLLLSLMIAGSMTLGAQKTLLRQTEGPPNPVMHLLQGMAGSTAHFLRSEFSLDLETVQGVPYSADAVTEVVQLLPDGNRISRRTVVKHYRDSEGRTRREHTLEAIGPWVTEGEPLTTIAVNDPVEGRFFILHPEQKKVVVQESGIFALQPDSEGEEGRKAVSAKVFILKSRGAEKEGNEIDVEVREKSGEDDSKSFKFKQFRIESPFASGSVFGRPKDGSGAVEGHTASEILGTRTIEGILAEGTRSVFTIPAGEIGNEKPIEVVTERWYSPDLQTVIQSRHYDPRFGETTFRLTNISRSEPHPDLFQIPSDFTVEKGSGFHFRFEREKQPQ